MVISDIQTVYSTQQPNNNISVNRQTIISGQTTIFTQILTENEPNSTLGRYDRAKHTLPVCQGIFCLLKLS